MKSHHEVVYADNKGKQNWTVVRIKQTKNKQERVQEIKKELIRRGIVKPKIKSFRGTGLES